MKKALSGELQAPAAVEKSSLIKAVCKLEKCSGSVFYQQYGHSLFIKKGFVPDHSSGSSKSILIAGTILENICYGLEQQPSDKEVKEALTKPISMILSTVCRKEFTQRSAREAIIYPAARDSESPLPVFFFYGSRKF